MIQKINGYFILTCDICNNEANRMFVDFGEAVNFKKTNDWTSKKRKRVLQDICPNC